MFGNLDSSTLLQIVSMAYVKKELPKMFFLFVITLWPLSFIISVNLRSWHWLYRRVPSHSDTKLWSIPSSIDFYTSFWIFCIICCRNPSFIILKLMFFSALSNPNFYFTFHYDISETSPINQYSQLHPILLISSRKDP